MLILSFKKALNLIGGSKIILHLLLHTKRVIKIKTIVQKNRRTANKNKIKNTFKNSQLSLINKVYWMIIIV